MTPFPTAVRNAGITYRQAEYWRRRGWITVHYFDNDGNPIDLQVHGMSGFRAYVEGSEARVLEVMGRLVIAGVKPEVAHHAARRIHADKHHATDIAPGVTVVVRPGRVPGQAKQT